MKILTLLLVTISVLSTKCFCAEIMKFSDDDLKNFSMRTQPQKSRNIIKIDQNTDVFYFEKATHYDSSGENNSARCYYMEAAERGHSEALKKLSNIYAHYPEIANGFNELSKKFDYETFLDFKQKCLKIHLANRF